MPPQFVLVDKTKLLCHTDFTAKNFVLKGRTNMCFS